MIADLARFAEQWCEAWNAHDLDRSSISMRMSSSPRQPRRGSCRNRAVESWGKTCCGPFGPKVCVLLPELRFEIENVTVGLDTLVIGYRNERGVRINEVLIFDGDRVRIGAGTYPVGD